MNQTVIQYDHINKQVVVVVEGQRFTVPVMIKGTKHASISRSVIDSKVPGTIAPDLVVAALKRYRNNKGNSLIVSVES